MAIMKTPTVIQKAMARWFDYDGSIEYLGKYQDKDAFCYNFTKPVCLGFPSVYLLNSDDSVSEIDGFQAMDIINSFSKDF